MRVKIRCDCTGEPPGELIRSATAFALRSAKARSSGRATIASVSPGRSGVEKPMTPDSRTTGTTGMSLRNRAGSSEREIVGMRSRPWRTPESAQPSAQDILALTTLQVTHCLTRPWRYPVAAEGSAKSESADVKIYRCCC